MCTFDLRLIEERNKRIWLRYRSKTAIWSKYIDEVKINMEMDLPKTDENITNNITVDNQMKQITNFNYLRTATKDNRKKVTVQIGIGKVGED